MKRVLIWKFAIIAVVTLLAVILLYPPDKKLKPGIDLAGGTSLIYEIDTQGIPESDQKDLAQKMITVLRRRIDPANIQNLVWRALGNTRFEIQMPLSSPEAREKREAYETSLNELISHNINTAKIMRSLSMPAEQRTVNFQEYAGDFPQRLEVLNNLSDSYEQLQQARAKRDGLAEKLQVHENLVKEAGLNLDEIKDGVGLWIDIANPAKLTESVTAYLADDFSDKNLQLLLDYTAAYSEWSKAIDEITDPVKGKYTLYAETLRKINQLNLTEDQLKVVLDMLPNTTKRNAAIDELKTQFPDRTELIQKVITAFDGYRPFQGRLDDPKDLQRMLKGAGILEFRILPTRGHPDNDGDMLDIYVTNLKEKGPKFASDSKYVWCQIEDGKEWFTKDLATGQIIPKLTDREGKPVIIETFGDKIYVLASSKPNEGMLYQTDKQWKLKQARPTQDQQGRRAIGFSFDDRAAYLFGNLTEKNLNRPLCILLDGLAISAPTIQSRITSDGIITGSFTKEEVDDMVNKLNAGSLPAMLIEQPISIKSIGPAIGADNRDKGIYSGIIGLMAVVASMLIYYMLGGSAADVALLLNILVVLASMAWLRATFTLPGIAGLILSIGMSVDANVLIFERVREEQAKGSSLRIALKNGHQRAFGTILDSNLTTILTALVLFWVAPEEIKGFAIVLILGIAISMFTALFVTRTVIEFLMEIGLIKNRLAMMQLIKTPKINWMGMRWIMLTISLVCIVSGLIVFFVRDDSKYDIEFTGGTSVQVNLKEPVQIQLVRDRIERIGQEMKNPAIATANVYSVGELNVDKSGKQFEINTIETNKMVTTVSFGSNAAPLAADMKAKITEAEKKSGHTLPNLAISPDEKNPAAFKIATSQLNKSLVKNTLSAAFPEADISEPQIDEIVNKTILTAFADLIEIRQNLNPDITAQEKITEQLIEKSPEMLDYIGGVKITCKLGKPTTGDEIIRRFKDLRFKPEMRDFEWYSYHLYNSQMQPLTENEQLDSFIYASVQPEAGARTLSEDEWNRFFESERAKVTTAAEIEESLPRVTEINPSISSEAKTQALIAIVLSVFAISAYIWVRFGNLRYGLAAIASLVHDVCIAVGAVAAATYFSQTSIGQALLIGDFKINQVIIAAFLTLIGYSLNDTIVVFDRIRENRRANQLTPKMITDSINQTLSRTLLTGITTMEVVLIMYIFGGQALRGFNYTILLGLITGTYSSIAIAAPLLILGTKTPKQEKSV